MRHPVLVIIPARYHSAGIPGKNFRRLPDGTTCIGRAIACAQRLRPAVGSIVVTTDHPRYVAPAGVILHRRSACLARPETRMADVIRDVLEAYPGPDEQLIVLLQPTVPLRRAAIIEQAIRLARSVGAVCTISRVPDRYQRPIGWSPTRRIVLPERRQTYTLAPDYLASGDVYVWPRYADWPAAWTAITVPESINLDTREDWLRLRRHLRPAPAPSR